MGVKVGLSAKGNNRLRVFENGVLRGIFGPKRDEFTEMWRSTIIYVLYHTLLGRLDQEGWAGRCM
jgi:hypothetical protein